MKKTILLLIPLAIAILGGCFLMKSVRFKEDLGQEIGHVLSSLLVIALFVERLIEVVVSIWREPDQEKKDHAVATVSGPDGKALAGKEADQEELKKTQVEHKADTGVFASAVGLCIGVLVAAVSFQCLGHLFDPQSLGELPETQRKLFVGVDILLTGAVLSGGSDAVHKIFNAFNAFMDAARRQSEKKG
jgi:hypothetical protein